MAAATELTPDTLRALRILYESGAPAAFISARLGMPEKTVVSAAAVNGWKVSSKARDEWLKEVDKAAEAKVESERNSSALLISADEAEILVEELGSKERTVKEQAVIYDGMMARVAMRVGVMALQMTNSELLKNVDSLSKLDIFARKAFGPVLESKPRSERTTVNVMASAGGLPPMVSDMASVKVMADKEALLTPGGLPPMLPDEDDE
jgi:archaellum component FlaF (FlaF/FlaG flagellin family)